MIKIKFHQNFTEDNVLYELINMMTPQRNYKWKNLKIVNDESYDYFIIFNKPNHNNYNPANTIVFESETKSTRDEFSTFYKHNKEEYFYVYDVENHHNVDFWFHGFTYEELLDENLFIKDKCFSIINSNLNNLSGHKLRNNFINLLSFSTLHFDLFGRYHSPLKHYKGALNRKGDGLKNYKYTFNCENNCENNYFTEKLLDGIFCECLTFYYGCPNVNEFIDEKSFIQLDLHDFDKSFNIIKSCIDNNIWEERLPYIQAEKKRLMEELNPLNIISNIINKGT